MEFGAESTMCEGRTQGGGWSETSHLAARSRAQNLDQDDDVYGSIQARPPISGNVVFCERRTQID